MARLAVLRGLVRLRGLVGFVREWTLLEILAQDGLILGRA